MNTKDTIQEPKSKTPASIGFIAESIRRLHAQELAALVSALCQDNMGSKLATALQYENLDKQFQSGV